MHLRLGNILCDPGGSILAVLDWELATFGGPAGRPGLAAALVGGPGEAAAFPVAAQAPPSVLDGFPSRHWLARRHGEQSGADLSHLPFYLAFANWCSACISAAVLTRYQTGIMADAAAAGSPEPPAPCPSCPADDGDSRASGANLCTSTNRTIGCRSSKTHT